MSLRYVQRQFGSVHVRHDQIGQNQVYWPRLREYPQRFFAVASLEDGISALQQHGADHLANDLNVLDYQNRFRARTKGHQQLQPRYA